MIKVQYKDLGMKSRGVDGEEDNPGHRFARYNTVDEAVCQAAHDQARDGRDHSVVFWDGDKKLDLADRLKKETAVERERLEELAGGADSFIPAELLAKLSFSQVEALREELRR